MDTDRLLLEPVSQTLGSYISCTKNHGAMSHENIPFVCCDIRNPNHIIRRAAHQCCFHHSFTFPCPSSPPTSIKSGIYITWFLKFLPVLSTFLYNKTHSDTKSAHTCYCYLLISIGVRHVLAVFFFLEEETEAQNT